MAQHNWGDESFDWTSLYKAVDEMAFWGRKIGRIGGQIKEKWGEIRWYTNIVAPEKLSDLVYPGYYYYVWSAEKKPILNVIDQMSIVYMRPLRPLLLAYKRFFYAYAYRKAIRKFPHITEEILACCGWPELLFRSERKLRIKIWGNEEEDS